MSDPVETEVNLDYKYDGGLDLSNPSQFTSMRTILSTTLITLSFSLARPTGDGQVKRYDAIVPGARWLDTNGEPIRAHAAGMVRAPDGTFYWFGEQRRPGGTYFTGFSVYSSRDLYNWKNEGLAFSPVEGTVAAGNNTGERPKVVWSELTKQWVVCRSTMINARILIFLVIAVFPRR